MITPGRVLVVGGGAREHALAWRLARDQGVAEVHVAPGNPGMGDVAIVHGDADDLDAIVALAGTLAIDLVVVGPEAPLAAGLADALIERGVAVFGPTRAAAALESSKSFCRAVAEIAGIPMAEGASFAQADEAIAYARALGGPIVVKADGLAGGKGVTICETLPDAEIAIRAALDDRAFGDAGSSVVVERRLEGHEATVMAICDGERALPLPVARDYKRVADGDRGVNTGGMGAFAPLPDVDEPSAERIVEAFHRPALAEMARRGVPFRGLLYAGLMLTDDGPRLLEFNARFGDPESQAVVPLIEGPFAATLLAAAAGDLRAAGGGGNGRAHSPLVPSTESTVAVVLATRGYPRSTTDPSSAIDGVSDARRAGALVFHGATTARGGRLVTGRGRVLTVVGRDADVAHARRRAYDGVARIRFEGMQYRRDIGAVPAEASASMTEEDRHVLEPAPPRESAPRAEQPAPRADQPASPAFEPERPSPDADDGVGQSGGGESTVAVVVGSPNDLKRLDEARDVFEWFGIVYEVHVASAHRSPRRVLALAEDAAGRGIRVMIAGAGKAAALPGVVAAATTLPVIGVPFSSPDLGGMDALLSAVQMPRGVPVATVAIDGVANAAILAAEICALSDPRLRRRLVEFKARLSEGSDVMRLVRGEDERAPREDGARSETPVTAGSASR